ncbi:phytanoyl-CoA dioxygenase family protein [uncultured Maribacter sp.]|jgi:ectoine hydroxylase-related dioxygenase (phytanoyl-CoA dioxygenase family)|uniref:phytanoyl-CoA dioxygenase family protein n=1 Tax=uncultured Maribacter sp. TaxID=431308 RepID=UPI0026379625|nr:phytanoyl-CoA dioxygenase family protein [uncultured Maribacter sp.]
MRYNLTAEEISSYRTNGFLIVDDFLNEDEVKLWKDTIDLAITKRQGRKFPHSEVKTGDSDGINKDAEYFGKVFDQIINLWMTDEGVKNLMLDKRLGKMAADLSQAEGIRIWHDQSLVKQPWGNPTSWHLDTPFWSFNDREALSIWVALEDVTLQNGCLYFMPGSNKDTELVEPGIGSNMGDIFNSYPKYGSKDPQPAVIKAGSCTFHNGLTIHAAGVNMTPRTRKAMTCAYMPDGAVFNGKQNVLSDDYFKSLKIGDLLDNEEQNPLIYHKNRD